MSRKLDVELAKLLGYKVQETDWPTNVSENTPKKGQILRQGYFLTDHKDCLGRMAAVPRYSRDGNDMLKLEKEMMAAGFELSVEVNIADKKYTAHYYLDGSGFVGTGYADTEPLARAQAAYEAITGEEWLDG